MSAAVMVERIIETSPRLKARIAGSFYLLEMLTGGFAVFFVGSRLFVSGDAAATATNILAHQSLFRWGFAANLIQFACYIAVTGLLYDLFKPVSRSLSLLAAFFSIVGCTIGAVSCLFYLAPLAVLGGAPLSVFTARQVQALSLLSLKLYAQCFNISFVFFGFYCLLIGYLISKSRFLPRILGAGMALAGLGWLTFLSPPLQNYLSPYILAVGIGEVALTLWLLVMGVNAERWKEQASAAGRWRS